MKLYYHPTSTASRPILLFCAEHRIPFEPVVVDLMKGEQQQAAFLAINPSGLVPVIEDDGFVLTESSAILKYLAEKHHTPDYPEDLRERARVNERMDWFNTQFYRDYGFNLIYPQVMPHHVRSPESANHVTVEWGKRLTERWLSVLNDQLIGSQRYLCGDKVTLADYLASGVLTIGDMIGVSYENWPNVNRWLKNMYEIPSWKAANEGLDMLSAAFRTPGREFVFPTAA